MASKEFEQLAREQDIAFIKIQDEDQTRYLLMQFSDSEDCWDWTLMDEMKDDIDGGQFESIHANDAYEAMLVLFGDMKYTFEEVDLLDEEQVEFLDPDDIW